MADDFVKFSIFAKIKAIKVADHKVKIDSFNLEQNHCNEWRVINSAPTNHDSYKVTAGLITMC